MYFDNRDHAGQLLAAMLHDKYRYENCAVMSLSDGGVLVGEPIAAQLHAVLTMLLVEMIDVPGQNLSFGGVSASGGFTYNNAMSSGERDEYTSELHGYLEEQKREAFQRINRLLGEGGLVDTSLLTDRVIVIVTDGLDSSMPLQVARDFLKTVRYKKLVVAAPIVSVDVVDELHIMADELHILDVRENYMGADHYYTENEVPSHEATVEKINNIVLNWR